MKNVDLRAAARNVELPPGDMDAVMNEGATLAGRRRRVLAGGLTMSLVAAAAGVYAQLNDPAPVPLNIADETAQRGDVPIRWERVNSTSGLGFTTTMTQNSLYAVATGPGRGAASERRRVVWHSENGIDWSAVTDLGGDLYLANLADKGSRIYGVGTGAATASSSPKKSVSPVVIGTSDNGGRNWAKQNLPLDLEVIAAKSRTVGIYAVDLATVADGVVAIVTLNADPDVPALLPAGQTASNGWAITETGVDVLGDGPVCPAGLATSPPGEPKKPGMGSATGDENGRQYQRPCFDSQGDYHEVSPQETRGVTASYTWQQLGIDGDVLRAMQSEPIVFRAEGDSADFKRIDAPPIAELDGPGMLEQDGSGLILVGQKGSLTGEKPAPETAILRSADGRTWTPAATPPGFTYALTVGQLGGRTALVGETGSGPTLWVADDQGGWTSTSLTSAIDPALRAKSNVSLASASVGPLGVVAVVSVMPDAIAERGGVKLEQDGYTLHVLNDRWAAVITDSTGKELARSDSVMDRQSGEPAGSGGTTEPAIRSGGARGEVSLVNPETGAPIVTFPADKVRETLTDSFKRDGYESNFRVVASRDGITWSDIPVNELAGERVGMVIRTLMVGERAVIALAPVAKSDRDAPTQFALVGTPR